MIISVGMCANYRLMPCEMFLAKLLAQLLCLIYCQAVLNTVARVKTDYVVMAFDIAPTVVFAILEIGFHTGNGEIIFSAVQGHKAAVFTRDQPAVLIKNGVVRELVMLKKQIFLCGAIVGVFRA